MACRSLIGETGLFQIATLYGVDAIARGTASNEA